MSKVSEQKAHQGYTTEKQNCGNCSKRTFEKYLPQWMKKDNAKALSAGHRPSYGEVHKIEGVSKCSEGGFAVQKGAWCNLWSSI